MTPSGMKNEGLKKAYSRLVLLGAMHVPISLDPCDPKIFGLESVFIDKITILDVASKLDIWTTKFKDSKMSLVFLSSLTSSFQMK